MAVAAFASWHEGHEQANAVLSRGARLPAHCGLEMYSVLTRLPPPHRVSDAIAREFVLSRFRDPWLTLEQDHYRTLLLELADRRIAGGAAYDGLVGITAARYGLLLVSRDRRASRVYAALGIDFELAV